MAPIPLAVSAAGARTATVPAPQSAGRDEVSLLRASVRPRAVPPPCPLSAVAVAALLDWGM
jgi:hypothetical protein